VNGQHVQAVDDCRLRAVSTRFLNDVLQRHCARQRSPHAVLIVLANIYARQFPQLRDIQRLVESALVDRRLAKETERDLIGFLMLARERYPGPQRNLSTHNSMAAQKVNSLIK